MGTEAHNAGRGRCQGHLTSDAHAQSEAVGIIAAGRPKPPLFCLLFGGQGRQSCQSSARAHLPKSCQDGTQPPSQGHWRFGGLLAQLVAQLYLRGGKVPAVGTLATISLVSSGPWCSATLHRASSSSFLSAPPQCLPLCQLWYLRTLVTSGSVSRYWAF